MSSTSSEKHATSAENRSHNQGRQDRSYTTAQIAAVNRVRKCRIDDYYSILDIETPSSEVEIRKSYRKLALIMHPDKNGAPGADEAFKMVSKAFQILSDGDKKRIYDATGRDPESRGGGGAGGAGPGAGFGASPFGRAGGMHFEGDISPEDLFNIFFGGGGPTQFGGQFGGFGGPTGIRFQTPFGAFGQAAGAQTRRRAAEGQNQFSASHLIELLPLLLLLGLPLLLSLFGDGNKESTVQFNFQKEGPYSEQRLTPRYHIPYYIKPVDGEKLTPRKLTKLDGDAEIQYVRTMKQRCNDEYEYKARKLADSQGWFFTDEEAYKEAIDIPLYSCEILDQLGVGRQFV